MRVRRRGANSSAAPYFERHSATRPRSVTIALPTVPLVHLVLTTIHVDEEGVSGAAKTLPPPSVAHCGIRCGINGEWPPPERGRRPDLRFTVRLTGF